MNEHNQQTFEINDVPSSGGNKKLTLALVFAVAALLVAAALLLLTQFGIFTLIKGPAETEVIQSAEQGSFVKRDVYAILGLYAEEASGDKVHTEYALVPIGSKLVTVAFSSRYVDSAKAILASTYDAINGVSSGLDSYVVVQGTVGILPEDVQAHMYEWFDLNKAQLVEMGLIAETDDAATYLTDTALFVDNVGSYNQTLVIVLSSIAAVFALFALALFVLMAVGFFKSKAPQAPANATNDSDDAASGTVCDDAAPEASADDSAAPEASDEESESVDVAQESEKDIPEENE